MYELNNKIKKLKPYEPNMNSSVIHLDANESFLEIGEVLKKEIADSIFSAQLNRYPDPKAEKLCKAFAEFYGVPEKCVVAGNGSDELISVVFSAFLQKGENFATVNPDFSMYSFYGHIAEASEIKIEKNSNFIIDEDNVIEICNKNNVKLLIFSNPCNPTSIGLSAEKVRKIIKKVDALVVLDEAYMDFWNQSLLHEVENYDNLIILRTCSKALGSAALRIGFAVANSVLTNAIKSVKSPYNVNVISQLAGEVILKNKSQLIAAAEQITNANIKFCKKLAEFQKKYRAFTLLESCTNFAALVMDKSEKFCEYLAENGIMVRYTAGLVRITCGTPAENFKLLEVIEKYLVETNM